MTLERLRMEKAGPEELLTIEIKEFSLAFCSHYRVAKAGMWKLLRLFKQINLIHDFTHRSVTLTKRSYELLFKSPVRPAAHMRVTDR